MLVVPNKHALVMHLQNPEKVAMVLPTARYFNFRGKRLLTVPHSLDEVKVLNNMGIRAPSPIRYYYKWSGMYVPFKAQLETAAFLSLHQRAYVLSDIGSGKTMSALWVYDYLRMRKRVNKLLVVAPLSTLERTWGDEVFMHFPHLNAVTLHGSRDKRLKLLAQDADIYIINHHGLRVIAKELAKRPDIDLVIVDELAQCARNQTTDIWKSLNEVINKQCGIRRAWGMTGTPTPNDPTDAWAQCRLMTPETVPPYFNRFRELTMRQVSTYRWMARDNANDVVQAAMIPAVRFSRDECVDLPPCMYQTYDVGLTPEQEVAYKSMCNTLAMQSETGEIRAVNEGVKLGKLLQIACGIIYDKSGNEVSLPVAPRIEQVKQIVAESASKAIVFVPFVSAIHLVADALRAAGYSVGVIHGQVSKNDRDAVFSAFQKSDMLDVIVAQPGAMSHGLTLTRASTIIWYAPITSNDIYEQANGRITRPGQKHSQLIANIEGSAVERKLYTRLRNKQKMQGLLLEAIRSERVAMAA